MIKRREFTQRDFKKVSDFLKLTYDEMSSNWYIDRWNFCRYFAQNWLQVFDEWPSTVGMWVDSNDEIVAIVCSEGEQKGEAFFQLKRMYYEEELINEMIKFAEENLYAIKEGSKYLHIRANNIYKDTIVNALKLRGYELENNEEFDSSMSIEGTYEVKLPEGFRIVEADNFNASLRGIAHAKAFRNIDSESVDYIEERTRGYAGLVKAPDYIGGLDLCILDEVGEITSFATVWFDEVNLVGILEPVGTITKYRRLGLGKAIIYEGINRIKGLGATKIHVGSNQEFYKAIGFSVEAKTEIWYKEF